MPSWLGQPPNKKHPQQTPGPARRVPSTKTGLFQMSILNRIRHALDRAKMSEFIPAVGYDDKRGIFAMRREAAKLESPVMDIGAAWYGVPSSGLDNQMVSDMEELMRQDFPPNTLMQIQRVATTQVNATINDF